MTKFFFITGTDTNVGKTISACALIQSAVREGYRTVGYKPIATGSKNTKQGLRNLDALALMKNSNISLIYHQVNPLAFLEPTSPNIASIKEFKDINFNILSSGLKYLKNISDWIIIEGVGGWFTPLGNNINYSDWVIFEKIPVIMVVNIKLGCINHAMLTSFAINKAKIQLAGWIANYNSLNSSKYDKNYLTTLKNSLNAPLLGEIPWVNEIEKSLLWRYINLCYLK